jgi:hypothetical protein
VRRDAAQPRQLAWPDFTYRENRWPAARGWLQLTLRSPRIRKTSNVFASISELAEALESRQEPDPMVGAATFQVRSVAPFNGGVVVDVYIDWPTSLLFQTSYLVVNP